MGWRLKRDPAGPELSSELATACEGLRAKMLGCPTPELLQAAQADVLPPDLASEVNQHLEKCHICKSLLADLESVDSRELDRAARQRIWKQIRAGMPEKAAAEKRLWWLRPLPVLAMAAALALVFVGVVRMRERPLPSMTAENHAPPSVAAQPSVFRLEKAPIVLPASAGIVWRGQEDASAKQVKELQRALQPYDSGKYEEAVRRLDSLRKKYPRMAEASFYLGVSQLFLNQNEQATLTLKDAVNLAGPSMLDQAQWYLSLANFRTGQVEPAISLLQPLCQAGGKDSARACAGVKELEARH
ncbi:MAG TPA: tetratricopeptide repeat protein [Candidatus Angelobacter sp.]|nr:tetratricopeptide repeat protein [Candidatus Angelobacter sp.]